MVDSTSENKSITLCLEGNLLNWKTNSNNKYIIRTAEFPSKEEIVDIVSYILNGIRYKEYIEDVKAKVDIEILFDYCDIGELLIDKETVNTSFAGPVTVETQYRKNAVYYVKVFSDDESLIKRIRESIDFNVFFQKNGRVITENEQQELEESFYFVVCGGQVIDVHYISEGTEFV